MELRLDYYKASPDAMKALMALEGAMSRRGLEPVLVELVKLRASQINGCAYCVDLHSGDLRKRGETERRVFGVPVWRDTPFFTERERAALAWTEALTLLPQTHAPQADYDRMREHFSAQEAVDLTLAIGLINTWNRVAVGFGKAPDL